eukprot:290822-Pyramimonas_sp.AAC.1
MGAGRSCAAFAAHMSYRAPNSDPCEPKDSNANPMASQVAVGCGRLRFRRAVASLSGGRRRNV